jgi:hypothetical protein
MWASIARLKFPIILLVFFKKKYPARPIGHEGTFAITQGHHPLERGCSENRIFSSKGSIVELKMK